VYYTNCPLVSASNVDQELGWTREEYKKIGVTYAFLRSTRENDWYLHCAGSYWVGTGRKSEKSACCENAQW